MKTIDVSATIEIDPLPSYEESTEAVYLEDVTKELVESIEKKEHILLVLVELPLNDEQRKMLEALPKSSYVWGWAHSRGHFKTLDQFKKWWIDRVEKHDEPMEWFAPVGLKESVDEVLSTSEGERVKMKPFGDTVQKLILLDECKDTRCEEE